MRRSASSARNWAMLMLTVAAGACQAADPSFGAYAEIVAEEDAAGGRGVSRRRPGASHRKTPGFRAWAVRALGRQENPDLLSQITPLLSDQDSGVREASWFAVGQALYGEPAMGRVLELVADRAPEVDAAVLGSMATVVGWAGVPEDGGASLAGATEVLADLGNRIGGGSRRRSSRPIGSGPRAGRTGPQPRDGP